MHWVYLIFFVLLLFVLVVICSALARLSTFVCLIICCECAQVCQYAIVDGEETLFSDKKRTNNHAASA